MDKQPKNLKEALRTLEEKESIQSEPNSPLDVEIENLRRTVNELKPQLLAIGSQIREQGSEAVKESFASLKNQMESVEATLQSVSKEIEGKVKENPWTSLGIAAFVGFLLGLILGRRK